MAVGRTMHLGEVVPNLQSKPNNVLSRFVGNEESIFTGQRVNEIYNQVTQWFSSQEASFVIQISDEETTARVDWLRKNIMPVLLHLVNGNLEIYSYQKRLEEAHIEVDEVLKDETERSNVKTLLELVQDFYVRGKEVNEEDWRQKYNEVPEYKDVSKPSNGKNPKNVKSLKKAESLISHFDARLFGRMKLREIIAAVESDIESMDYKRSTAKLHEHSLVESVIDEFNKNNDISFEPSYCDKQGVALFECDKKTSFTISCVDSGHHDVPDILGIISKLYDITDDSLEEIKKDNLRLLLDRLRRLTDNKTVVYGNLFDLFDNSREKDFAKTLKNEFYPNIIDLNAYSSFLVSYWQTFVKMVHTIRLKLESINPSQYSNLPKETDIDATKKLESLHDLETLQNLELKNVEFDKRCSYNRLAYVFSYIDDTVSATSLGGPFPERLRGMYFRVWGSLQHVVDNDEVDDRIFCKATVQGLNTLVKSVQTATSQMSKNNTADDDSNRLQILYHVWNDISVAIDAYLLVLKDDRRTLPVLLDNHVFQIYKANSLLPRVSQVTLDTLDDDVHDTMSRLAFKIYYIQIFSESLCKTVERLRTDFKSSRIPPVIRNKPKMKHNAQRLVDEIQFRERNIKGSFATNASYAAAFRIICEAIVRHASWYFCVGPVGSTDNNRYNIDFQVFDPEPDASSSQVHIERLPDIGNYVLYMKQYVDENNRIRKTSALKA